jgi:hypothetical protein
MSKATIKTNNDERYLDLKVQMRLQSIEELPGNKVRVYETNGGEGILWRKVQLLTKKKIEVLSIDVKKYNRVQIEGDNVKLTKSLDLSLFDVVDIDVYGSPFELIDMVLNKGFKGIVHGTFINSLMGALPNSFYKAIGVSHDMRKRSPVLFGKRGSVNLFDFLSRFEQVDNVVIFSANRKNYFYFVAR